MSFYFNLQIWCFCWSYLIGNAWSRLGRFYIWLSQLFFPLWKKITNMLNFFHAFYVNRSIRVGRRERASQWGLGFWYSEMRGTRPLHKAEAPLSSKGAVLLGWEMQGSFPTRSGTWKIDSSAGFSEGQFEFSIEIQTSFSSPSSQVHQKRRRTELEQFSGDRWLLTGRL